MTTKRHARCRRRGVNALPLQAEPRTKWRAPGVALIPSIVLAHLAAQGAVSLLDNAPWGLVACRLIHTFAPAPFDKLSLHPRRACRLDETTAQRAAVTTSRRRWVTGLHLNTLSIAPCDNLGAIADWARRLLHRARQRAAVTAHKLRRAARHGADALPPTALDDLGNESVLARRLAEFTDHL